MRSGIRGGDLAIPYFGEARGFSLIVTGRVRRAVAKEDHAIRRDLDDLGLGLVGEATNGVIAVAIVLVRRRGFPGIRDESQGAVGDVRSVHCDPHRCAAGLGDLEVGVVLMPCGAPRRV